MMQNGKGSVNSHTTPPGSIMCYQHATPLGSVRVGLWHMLQTYEPSGDGSFANWRFHRSKE